MTSPIHGETKRRDPEASRRNTSRALLAAFAAVNVLYLAVAISSQYTTRRVDAAASRIANEAEVKIRDLSLARGEMRRLESLLFEQFDRALAGRPVEFETVQEPLVLLSSRVGAYLAIEAFPDETSIRQRIGSQMQTLRAAVQRGTHALEQRDLASAGTILDAEVEPAVTQLGVSLMAGVDINSHDARGLALSIRRARETSFRLALWLGTITVLLSAAIAAFALRLLHRYERALDAMRVRAEGRANEFEQFAGRVAHDISSPLTSASLALQLVERAEIEPALRTVVARGRSALDRVQRLVSGLLEFARAGASARADARAELRPVIDDVVTGAEPIAAESRISLVVESVADLAVRCSPGVLTSLLSNLVQNAIKYMGDSPIRTITVRAVRRTSCVRVEVEDTGPGIPPGLEQNVFEPYVRVSRGSQPGLGLGLATVKRMAEAHGGAVGVERVSDANGSRFWFELPLAATADTTAS